MATPSTRAPSPLLATFDSIAPAIEPMLIAWRRDIHQHPELGNREFRTSALVADHLRRLGLDSIRTPVAHTGIVALLRGAHPGPTVALRADMDALPVPEEVDLPFASRAKAEWNGSQVGVMHACGHDAHVAILMGVAELLASMRERLHGSILFLFQPAEEMPPEGEEGGAQLMIKEGALDDPRPDAIFGLHVTSLLPTGVLGYRPGPTLASADRLEITVHGRQTHGAMPWLGVDPIVAAAQVVLGLQTVASRQVDVTREPSVITIGSIHGGLRDNIIPERVELLGTIRTFDEPMRDEIHARVAHTARHIAESAHARAEVCIHKHYGVTVNDPALTARMLPTLERAAGAGNVLLMPKIAGAEDFSFYARLVPGLFYFVGVTPRPNDPMKAPPNHSPRFYVDESGLLLGLRSLAHLALDFLEAGAA